MAYDFILNTGGMTSHGLSINIAGMDLKRYKTNSIALFNHNYDNVIGTFSNVRKSKGNLLGSLEFADTDFARDKQRLVDQGVLKAVSVGIGALEFNDDFTEITKSELFETSLVSVPADPGALIYDKKKRKMSAEDIKQLQLSAQISKQEEEAQVLNTSKMEKQIEELKAQVEALQSKLKEFEDRNVELTAKNKELRAAEIESFVNAAISEGKFTIEQKPHYVNLAKTDMKLAKDIVNGMQGFIKKETLSAETKSTEKVALRTWEDYQKNDPAALLKLSAEEYEQVLKTKKY